MATSLAMRVVPQYVAAARTQIARIREGLEESRRLADANTGTVQWVPAHQQAFVDMHFYFLCWSRVASMIEVVTERSGFPIDLRPEDWRLLNHYRDARHALEHLEDRLPGSKRRRKMKVPSDLGNLAGDVYTFGGKEWDLGETGLRHLERITRAIEVQVRTEGIARHKAGRAV